LFSKTAFLLVSSLPVLDAQSSRAPASSLTPFDAAAMDKPANPCVDFYQYA